MISSTILVHTKKNYLYYKGHYLETKTAANIFTGVALKSR